jgi:hypothetical protein
MELQEKKVPVPTNDLAPRSLYVAERLDRILA